MYLLPMHKIFCRPYDVNESVQLVCKYLRAYEHRSNVKWGINKLYDENSKLLMTSCLTCFMIFILSCSSTKAGPV